MNLIGIAFPAACYGDALLSKTQYENSGRARPTATNLANEPRATKRVHLNKNRTVWRKKSLTCWDRLIKLVVASIWLSSKKESKLNNQMNLLTNGSTLEKLTDLYTQAKSSNNSAAVMQAEAAMTHFMAAEAAASAMMHAEALAIKLTT